MATSANGTGFAATVVTMTVLAFIVLCSRIAIRTRVVKSFGPDDWFVIAAMTFTIVMSAMMLLQVHHGLGKHTWQVSQADQIEVSKYFYVSVIFYNGAVGLVKISILLQYLRIFAIKKMQVACRIVLALNTMFTIETVIISIFDCSPIPYFWDKSIKGGHCVNFGAMWFSHASTNIAFDIILVILPMPVIKSLNLPRKQKIALMGIFALGTFATVTSILRLSSIYSISYSNDVTYDNVGAALWSTVEINTAIICASLPTFKAFVNRIFPRLLGSTRSQSSAACHRSRTWNSRLGLGTTKNHHTLDSLNEQERGECDTVHLELTRRDGQLNAVRTNCEKTAVISEGSSHSSRGSDDGIKVVTVVTQQRTRPGSDEPATPTLPPTEPARTPSLTQSERGFFMDVGQHDRI
ncbi:putative pth11-like integral membrane protein [Diplodia seriata]|uniref:Putative pth11-like integral membrane protein n=1 Tax=Diplodia seriata TaxID=420778 RepID=A0A0G2E3F8_9PEZI|nr:putative pth11-like integral membrane protein [Diplodia seriata]